MNVCMCICVCAVFRVLDILTYWIKKCWPDIYRNPPVVSLSARVCVCVCLHALYINMEQLLLIGSHRSSCDMLV